MTVLRSPRLEALLGGAIPTAGSIEYRHLELLKGGQVGEAEDLDYKRELYRRDDKGRISLSTDVAALASTRGGVLILGIAEDDQGRAVAMTDVELSDAEATRMHQVIGSGVHPLPTFEIIPVENPATPGKGCYVIAVGAGQRQPYAVAVNDGYRYPRRIGMTIGYLTEPEIETAYRRRDAIRRDQIAVAQEREAAIVRHIDPGKPWVIVSLVPDQPGEITIDSTTFANVRSTYMSSIPMIVGGGEWAWRRVTLGQRHFALDDRFSTSPMRMLAKLYDDGSGTFTAPPYMQPAGTGDSAWLFDDELLVNIIMSGLRFLASHARENAHTTGTAVCRVRITQSDDLALRYWQLTHGRGQFNMGGKLGDSAHHDDFQPAEASASLQDLTDSPGLVSTAAILGSEIFQGFGVAEALQITQRGQVRRKYWAENWGVAIEDWARQHDIEITEEELKQ
ncbi:AlbA family DNA-binding domain-containing protein [Nonomuraea jabiensis]|uniref:AlbA family DNA-binding domain-containing protein n=1 Tax=Nonomuraea jabiensis TaxID=882448 RepID=UPI003D725237